MRKICDAYCNDCIYYCLVNQYGGIGYACHYILITRRKRPCKPGVKCKVKEKREYGKL